LFIMLGNTFVYREARRCPFFFRRRFFFLEFPAPETARGSESPSGFRGGSALAPRQSCGHSGPHASGSPPTSGVSAPEEKKEASCDMPPPPLPLVMASMALLAPSMIEVLSLLENSASGLMVRSTMSRMEVI